MKKRWNWILMGVLLIAVMIPFFGCSSSEEGTFEGELINATADRLTLESDSDVKEFVTAEGTVYDLGDETEITKGDILSVAYHSEGDELLADTVTVEQADDPHYEAHGIVGDVSDTTILLSIDSAESGISA